MISERVAEYFRGLRGGMPPQIQPWMNEEEAEAVKKSRRWIAFPMVEDLIAMEITVNVRDEQEAYLVKAGLQNDELKAFVEVCTVLNLMTDDDNGSRKKAVLHAACCLYGCDE